MEQMSVHRGIANLRVVKLASAFAAAALMFAAQAANIVDTAKKAGTFGGLVESLREADMTGILSEKGPYTLFAPSDEAFSKMPSADRELLKHDKEQLKAAMAMHIVKGTVLLDGAKQDQQVTTLGGQTLTLHKSGSEWSLNGVTVLEPDVQVDNGVIHVIDSVLMPKK